GPACRGAKLRIPGLELSLSVKRRPDIEHQAATRRGVMMAPAQRIKRPSPAQLAGEQEGQPAIGAEQRGTGVARTVSALMAIGIGKNADAISLLQRVVQEPLESTPIGRYVDRALDARVMRHFDIGIAAADMGEH